MIKIKIKTSLIGINFFYQKRKQVISLPCTLILDFIFSTYLYRYQNVLKCILSNIENWPKNNLNAKFWKIAQFYDECLQLETKVRKMRYKNRCYSINLTYILFTVDVLFSLISFHHFDVCIFVWHIALFN